MGSAPSGTGEKTIGAYPAVRFERTARNGEVSKGGFMGLPAVKTEKQG
jgi:hypothetical protein